MKPPSLLAGYRWVALIVAAMLVVGAGFLAYFSTVRLTLSNATFTALVSIIGTALTVFFWVVDRQDRLAAQRSREESDSELRAQAEVVRRADVRPHLEFIMSTDDAGGGYFRNSIRLVNHGPGSATEVQISGHGLTATDVGTRALESVWTNPDLRSRARNFGPFRQAGLAVGVDNGTLTYRDSELPSTGGVTLPLGSSDFPNLQYIRLRADCIDGDGRQVEPVFGVMEKAGGFYVSQYNVNRWVEGYRLRA